MNKNYITLCVLSLALLAPNGLWAQNKLVRAGKAFLSNSIKKSLPPLGKPKFSAKLLTAGTAQLPPFKDPHMSPERALSFSRAVASKIKVQQPLFRQPELTPVEQYVRHFIFTVSQRGVQDPFKGSGFVIAEKQGDKTVLWGVSGAHVVRYMGKDVNVTFYSDGKEYTYPAEIVLTGRKYGLNAALIKLPPEVAEVALPVISSTQAPKPGDPLFTFGFSAGTYKKTFRHVLFSGDERVVANFPSTSQPRPGFCGSLVLNAQGQAVGIEVGGYSPQKEGQQWYQLRQKLDFLPQEDLSRISEIVPISRAYDLLNVYRHPDQAARTMWFNGIRVGQLAPDEFIESVTVRYANGKYFRLMRNPFMQLTFLEKPFSLPGALQAEIVVNKGRAQTYVYLINLFTREVEKKDSW